MSEINVGKVAMVEFSSIQVGDRARKEMGDLDGMEESIKDRGLIQQLAVKELNDGSFMLLAGERRYRVLERNQVDMIPVRIFPEDITELEMKSIEIAENYYRNAPFENPVGPVSGEFRVFRGGSWFRDFRFLRVSTRFWGYPEDAYDGIGFRCLHSP